ncbi:hypothetical protein PPSQR21_014810 [Paenibacillus polymyxa SQR-21]|nr:hypothetical protein PPSQR21_014810 [Paenibacillus polymyxa SQR-21]
MIDMNAKEKKAYDQGRMVEAEITLENLYRILDEMTEQPHERSHIIACIRDLERDTGKDRAYFKAQQNALED